MPLVMLGECGGNSSQQVKRTCAAANVARVVGEAIGTGNAAVVRPVLMTGEDVAWLQNAPTKHDRRDAAFNQRVYEQAVREVRAWHNVSGDAHVVRVELNTVQRNRAVEGFGRSTDVIDDAVVILAGSRGAIRVVIQHMFSIDGCWRVVEIGNPK